MAVERKTLAITLWCVCGGVLIIVIILFLVYCCCFRNNKSVESVDRQKYYEEHDTHEMGITGNPHHHARHQKASKVSLFPGFSRRNESIISSSPACGLYTLPQTVHLLTPPNQSDGEMILINIIFTPPSNNNNFHLNTNNGQPLLLGTDMFDSRHPTFVYDCNNFLRYTGPLYFESSGNYIVQAHVVNPSLKTVGAIHQFQYILMLNESGFRSPSRRGSTPRHNTNTIDINYNRQYSEENNNNNNQVAIYNNTASVVPYSNALLQAPVIIPGSGEVTAGTRIRLEHSRQSAQLNIQNVNLYYSLDGSPPSTLYTEPFPLLASNLSSPTQGSKVHIKAIAIGAVTNNNQNNGNSSTSVSSPVAQAHLTVRPAGYSYYDPSVSSPSARVRTVNALLYFDESKNPPRTKTVYQFIFISEVRAYALYEATDKKKSDPSFLLPGKKLKFNKNKCFTYSGEPIPITEDLAQIYAWTVDEDFLESNNFDVDDEAAMRQRSGAAIYDCTYATAMQLDPSKRRSSDHQAATSFLPAPVLCISCSDVELEFEEPPAHCLIAYTLNGKEPALYDVDPPACAAPLPALSAHRRGGDHAVTNTPRKRTDVTGDLEGMNTYIYRVNKIIKISLLSAETVHVTARVFLPVYEDGSGQVRGNYGGQGGSGGTLLGYRYGDVFHRAFYFSGN